MKRSLTDFRYHESYYYAQSVSNILRDQFAYLRDLNDFYGDGRISGFVKPFPRYSTLHCFIEEVVAQTVHEENAQFDLPKVQSRIGRYGLDHMERWGWFPTKLPFDVACEFYSIKHEPFAEWLFQRDSDFQRANEDDLNEFLEETVLSGTWEQLIDRIVGEVFFILFQNRDLLLIFNEMMARQIHDTDLEEIAEEYLVYFSAQGRLKRVSIPEWVKKAVYYRDRGLCSFCTCDLSGLVAIGNSEHFDHIVPLAEGGLNDVTNIQLLCADCNLKKGRRSTGTSTVYETWYPMN